MTLLCLYEDLLLCTLTPCTINTFHFIYFNFIGKDTKSESDSNTDGEMASYPHDDAAMLGHEKSEETYKEWDNYWNAVKLHRTDGILNVTSGITKLPISLIWAAGTLAFFFNLLIPPYSNT
jgi:hypothetical protein